MLCLRVSRPPRRSLAGERLEERDPCEALSQHGELQVAAGRWCREAAFAFSASAVKTGIFLRWLFQQNLLTEKIQPPGCPKAPGCHQFLRCSRSAVFCGSSPGKKRFGGLRGKDLWMAFNCTVDAGKNQCFKRTLSSRWWWRSSKRASSFLPLKAWVFLVLRYGRAVAALHVRVGWLPVSVRKKTLRSTCRWNNFLLLFVCHAPFPQKRVYRGSFVRAPNYLSTLCRSYRIENPLQYGEGALNFELARFFPGFLTCGWDVYNERSIIKNHLV